VLALAHSAAMLGIDGYVVRVEADSSAGTPGFAIIGLPDRALGEAKDRVRAAIVNAGYRFPAGRVLVNLAPAELKKVGPGFDLAIALSLLALDSQIADLYTCTRERSWRMLPVIGLCSMPPSPRFG